MPMSPSSARVIDFPVPKVRTLGDKLHELARRAPVMVIAIERWVDYLLRILPSS